VSVRAADIWTVLNWRGEARRALCVALRDRD
jgi:hypothetical protein